MKTINLEERLLKYGFKEFDENGLEYRLNSDGDRFQVKIIYEKGSNSFIYIKAKASGWREVTESEIINNHNNLQSASKEHFLKFKEDFKDIWEGVL